MKNLILAFFIGLIIFSCKREQDDSNSNGQTEIVLKSSYSDFMDAFSGRSSEISDPFELRDIVIKGDSVEITVSYSGGCKTHSFEIIWNETLSETTPPQTGIIILHNANGDMCEAYITDTLSFSISDLTDSVSFDTLCVGILNGWTPLDSISSGGWDPADTTGYDNGDYNIVIPEGDICQVNVTALNAICGAGLWGNLWLALDDSVSGGIDNFYFHKYLQPVAIEKDLEGFVPVQGKRYIVGARIQLEHPFLEVPVCLAYSGPSVPVRITCIEELK